MSDETTNMPTPAATPSPVDPVAEARRIMAAQDSGGDAVANLAKQVRVLWVMVMVTLVLTLAVGGYSIFGRMMGLGRPNFGNGNFTPGQFRQQGGSAGGSTNVNP